MSRQSNDRRFFSTSKKGEIAELKAELNAPNRDQKKDAVKKVIANMTIGKDVSALFMDVINCIQTDNLELKKLVYLYLINYAKSQPDLALAAVNTFVKDASDPNPLIRALAVRTMGCIRVERITEYLCDPLARALRDDDPYVRKTAALCVAKLYDISPSLVRERGFLDQLKELLRDGNSAVVANVVAALNEIADASSDASSVFEVDAPTLQKLLAALNECTEWGQVFLLEALCRYTPADGREAEGIIERITARLQHANTAVVMSAVKVILTYLPLIDNQDALRLLSRKLAPPLVSLLNSEPEIQYVALRNINLIVQQRPRLLDHEIKVFFCKYNDPIYVKMEKLEIIIKLVSERNVDQVLMELREYAQEVDVDFVRRAVRAIGRCAIKLERAAERCISVLLELIQSGVNYVVQEGIVVIKDIFRRYPNRYESIISTLCENLETLDEPEAKSSMIWIIGEYCDRIDNADDLLDTFLDTFQDETPLVQLQLLTAIVKLYLKREDADVEDMVTQVLNFATQECDNPDLRDRGYLYWRLLSASPEAARTVVLSERPNIGDDTFQLDDQLLDDLVRQLSTLASVYHKPPSSFIMRALPVGGGSSQSGEGYDDDDDDYGSPYIEEEGGEEEEKRQGAGNNNNNGGEIDLLNMDDLGFGDSQEEESKGLEGSPSFPQQTILNPSDADGLELIAQSLASVTNENGTPCLALSITVRNHNGSVTVPKIAFQFNKSFFGFSAANPVLVFNPPLGGGMSSTQQILLSPVAKLVDQDPSSKTSQNVTSFQVAVKNFGNNNVSYFLLPAAPASFLLSATSFPDAVLDPATLGASWVSIDDSLEVSSMVQNVTSSDLNFIKSALASNFLYYIADRPVPNTSDQRFIYFSAKSVDVSTSNAGAETVLVELRTKENTNAVKVSVKSNFVKLSETIMAVISEGLCN